MNIRPSTVILCALLAGPFAALAADPVKEPANTNRFTLRLTDGSSIICLPKLGAIPLKTSFADVQIPLQRIENLKLDAKSKTATLLLLNGDKLQGECPLTDMTVSSALGDLKIAMAQITELATTFQKTPVFADSPAKRKQCINQLRSIDHAKQQAATVSSTMTDNDVPNWDELTPYFRGNAKVVCPSGGSYSIQAITASPTCTVPGHALIMDEQ
ncbi:MAG: hypothetical protein WCR06_07500 [bacterium]